jgi:hypothetical protein
MLRTGFFSAAVAEESFSKKACTFDGLYTAVFLLIWLISKWAVGWVKLHFTPSMVRDY